MVATGRFIALLARTFGRVTLDLLDALVLLAGRVGRAVGFLAGFAVFLVLAAPRAALRRDVA
jgi:hypothetical protein